LRDIFLNTKGFINPENVILFSGKIITIEVS